MVWWLLSGRLYLHNKTSFFFKFWDRVSLSDPDWLQIHNPPASASGVAGITSEHYLAQHKTAFIWGIFSFSHFFTLNHKKTQGSWLYKLQPSCPSLGFYVLQDYHAMCVIKCVVCVNLATESLGCNDACEGWEGTTLWCVLACIYSLPQQTYTFLLLFTSYTRVVHL
jgi:hypothetical protein